MKVFYKLLGLSLISSTTNNFVWFALTFWIYLQTKSVISTSMLAGIWLVASAFSGIWFGAVVDHHKKKNVMQLSSIVTLLSFSVGLAYFVVFGAGSFDSVNNIWLWILVILLMAGVIVGNLYQITIPTLIPLLVSADRRDRANGMFGTVMGISFAITSVASGFVLSYFGFASVLIISIITTSIVLILLLFTDIKENHIIHLQKEEHIGKKLDIHGTINVVKKVPGLFSLIFFTTFNNFLGGVFMALMDAYGLSLVSVEVWGTMWGILSFGFIFGGLYIAKFGLGKNPLKALFAVNILLWVDCIFFTIQPSIWLLGVGMLIWMSFVPFIEASEQTILQKVVPHERLGRVIGFAHSIEQAASPITAFLIGPLTQLIFIPFMTTGFGAEVMGGWFGTGPGRGIALVFTVSGIIGLVVTLIARRSKVFYLLTQKYYSEEVK